MSAQGVVDAGQGEPAALGMRDLKCLEMLAEGKSTTGIAAAFGVSEHAARLLIVTVCSRLKAETPAQAVFVGRERGLI